MRDDGYDLIDSFLPLDKIKYYDPEGWKECKQCNSLPCLWLFDNGSHACCKCFEKYTNITVRTESIMSVLKRTGTTEEYYIDALKEAWNRFVETRKITTLEKGRW